MPAPFDIQRTYTLRELRVLLMSIGAAVDRLHLRELATFRVLLDCAEGEILRLPDDILSEEILWSVDLKV
jgi:hypothetical protein